MNNLWVHNTDRYGRMDGWMRDDRQVDKWTNRQIDEQTVGETDRPRNIQTDEWTNGQMDRELDRWTDLKTKRPMNRQMDRWTDGQYNVQMKSWDSSSAFQSCNVQLQPK